MGSACCVAAKDRTISNGSSIDTVQRNARYSPSWSFRWDNRGRVAGEETSMNWFSDRAGRHDGLDVKSQTTVETAYASEEGSPLDSFRTLTWQKSPTSEVNHDISRVSPSDPSVSASPLVVNESKETPVVMEPSTKMSPSMNSFSSVSTSPLSSQGHLRPGSTPLRWPPRSPGHQLLRQASDSRNPGLKSPSFSISEEGSPFVLPGWSNGSNRGSHGGSSDSWSIPAFSEFTAASRRERWSFDSESLSFSRDKMYRCSGRVSSSPPVDLRTCGVCSKLLTERSSWGSQKIISNNELAVIAILICGHVYHAECLENMTPEINKYDPACPVCTFGEKKTLKLSEKALRAEMDIKARMNKRSRSRVVDSDISGDSIVFDRLKSSENENRGPKMSSSSSMKISLGKPFLKRHFSLGSKGTKSMLESHSSKKKGFFWSRSNKE